MKKTNLKQMGAKGVREIALEPVSLAGHGGFREDVLEGEVMIRRVLHGTVYTATGWPLMLVLARWIDEANTVQARVLVDKDDTTWESNVLTVHANATLYYMSADVFEGTGFYKV